MRALSRLSACDTNGSGVQIASTWPLRNAVRMVGNGIASSLIEPGLTPDLRSAALIITSPTPLSALTAIVFPARSFALRIELSPLTRMFCQLSAAFVPSTSLVATALIGMPEVLAIIIGTQPK